MKHWPITPKQGLLWALAVTLACLLPILARGQVFFAHGNEIEVGLAPSNAGGALANRRLSDQSAAFAPELNLHLEHTHADWLATWNPHVQLGRPAHHTGGMSKAYWLTHVLSWFSDDALVVMSALVCLTLMLAAAFACGMALELGAGPWIAAAAGVGFALSPFAAYWSSFPLFLSGQAWTMGLLFCSARYSRTGSAWCAWGVALCSHSLLVAAYPQAVVWSLYLALPLILVWALRHGWKRAGWLSMWGLLGIASAAPFLADLMLAAQRSSRLNAETEFFTSGLPRVDDWSEFATAVSCWIDSSLRGNPLRNPRPAAFLWSAALTPLFACLAVYAPGRKVTCEVWVLLGYALWLFFASFVPAVYLFGWEHLGLSLSPFVPLGALLVPGILLAALGAQRVVSEARSLVWLALPLACMALDAKVNGASSPGVIAAALGIALVFLVFRRRDPRLIFACALASGLWYGTQNFLVRNPRSVARQSPLVDIVRSASADGTRFAWIAKEPTRILPPNQECWLGLESVHSYDSLSSRAYQDWSAEVSREPARTYGRKFDHIDGLNSISSEAFRRARIGVLLSLEDLRPVGYRLFARYGNVRVWQATECLPFASFANAPKLVVADERPNPESIRLQLREPGPEGLLVLSQQYHPHWSAQAEGRALECEPYQGVWQAVRVPAGVRSVSLEFHPWARFIWISQALFMLLALVLLLRSRLLRHRSVSVMELPPMLARAATPGGG